METIYDKDYAQEEWNDQYASGFETIRLDGYTNPIITEQPIPPDQRIRTLNTTNRPFRYICKLEMDGGGTCTGTLIAPNKVLTAAHCLSGASRVRVIPGKKGSGRSRSSEPFGSSMSRLLHIPSGFSVAGDNFDYAVITLMSNIGSRVGWWRRIAAWSDRKVRVRPANLAGYPGSVRGVRVNGNFLYRHFERFASVNGADMEYFHDTSPGQSGSPIWIRWRNTRTIVGVHATGDSSATPVVANTGVHITPQILADIRRMVRI